MLLSATYTGHVLNQLSKKKVKTAHNFPHAGIAFQLTGRIWIWVHCSLVNKSNIKRSELSLGNSQISRLSRDTLSSNEIQEYMNFDAWYRKKYALYLLYHWSTVLTFP